MIESLHDDMRRGSGVAISGVRNVWAEQNVKSAGFPRRHPTLWNERSGSCRRVRFCGGQKTPAPRRPKRKLPKSPILRGSLAASRQNDRSGSCRRVRFCGEPLPPRARTNRAEVAEESDCMGVPRCLASERPKRKLPNSLILRGAFAASRPNDRSGSCRRVRFCGGQKTPASERPKRKLPKNPILRGSFATRTQDQ